MDELLEYITLYRIVWIGGRLGFGKTALSVIIARRLLESGLVDGVITNFPSVFPPHISKDDGSLNNRVIIYDEAWADLDARTSMTNERAYGAYARKLGCYWIFPSVHPIDKRLRAIEIKPLYRNLITGANVYQYLIRDDDKSPTKGKFAVSISQSFGIFSTSYIPVGDCGISSRFQVSYYQETGELYDGSSYRKRADKELEAISTE